MAVDKEALLKCLITCREISCQNKPDVSQDTLHEAVVKYCKPMERYTFKLAKLDKDVSDLMDILLSDQEDA